MCCHSSTCPHCFQACHQLWYRFVRVEHWTDQVLSDALLSFSHPAALWLCCGETLCGSPSTVQPLSCPPIPAPGLPSPIPSASSSPPHLHPPSIPFQTLLHHLLPPSTPSQALGRKGTASALQTQGQKLPAGSHGNSFSLTLSPLPCSVKGSVENRRAPLFFSTFSHSPN